MDTTISVEKSTTLEVYKTADAKTKKLLEKLFGAEVFIPKITDRVKTFEDALKIIGADKNMKILLDYNGINQDLIAAKAFAQLTIIAKALNQGWQPNWADSNESKYYPWFEWKKTSGSGFGFSYAHYGHWHAYTTVGSRLCFKTSELAMYAGKQFEAIYNDFLTINK